MTMPRTSDPLSMLRSADRKRLLLAEDNQLIGLVIELNQSPHYHNGLDALRLAFVILQQRLRRRSHA
jgi:hypothetical protein